MTAWAGTGLKGLDEVLCGLEKGDNVVWQVDNTEQYRHFVWPYVNRALEDNRNVVYMRFAHHRPVVENQPGVRVYQLDANSGFESFSTDVHTIISKQGPSAFYVFDCLSDLLGAWATDLMIGNFFRVTCPCLYQLDTIAYFAILRKYHSFHTIARIRETTQLLLDVYSFDDDFYVHPLKVLGRYSPTMFLPHLQKDTEFTPVLSSIDAGRLLSCISQKGLDDSARTLDYWDRLFLNADTLAKSPPDSPQPKQLVRELCRIMIGRETKISDMVQDYFSLEDMINIKNRLIGNGFIGGKAAGMLLAQKILSQDKSFDWQQYLESHDSFYIASDVFYSYIVENDWWEMLMKQKTRNGYFEQAPRLKENLLRGKFPEQIRQRFREVVEYFGQSPIIVRSSSLLEDSFGNAFAGKYESLFLVNQGDPEQRYCEFEEAVRRVYASTMDDDALAYRLQRRLDQQDEQMALLVQRVSGSYKKNYFFPDLAGVGVSYSTFVWNPSFDPRAGMIRLVLGLGTRAVERVEDDYPQIINLDQPLLRPYAQNRDTARFSQHNVDLLDTGRNCLRTIGLNALLQEDLPLNLELVASPDPSAREKTGQLGLQDHYAWVLTFENFLSKTNFPQVMQKMLKTLDSRYNYPVDVEFTVNFTDNNHFKINLVQCRPLQTRGLKAGTPIPDNIEPAKILFASKGSFMGGNVMLPVRRIIYVDPQGYLELTISQKYSIARLIGKLNRQITNRQILPVLLLGPGRWGTTTPALGVPVGFAEINKISVLVEVAYEGGNLMPELSFGTHFFQDLVESDIFYVALFPQKETVVFNKSRLFELPNLLDRLVPDQSGYENIVRVCDIEPDTLHIASDVVSQKVICCFS